MLVKKLTPRVDQILVTYVFNQAIEDSLNRTKTAYRKFKKDGVQYLQYCTNNRYYHAPKVP